MLLLNSQTTELLKNDAAFHVWCGAEKIGALTPITFHSDERGVLLMAEGSLAIGVLCGFAVRATDAYRKQR